MEKNTQHTDANEKKEDQQVEKVIKIDRVNKVIKGGKRLAFRALVITGDQKGRVGIGLGKAKEVPNAIKKAIDRARKYQEKIVMVRGTLPHAVNAKFGSSKVMLKPARPGTGVIAGGSVRIVLEAAGLKNVVAKIQGSSNAINAARAALLGLKQCRLLADEEQLRGKKLPVYTKQADTEEQSSKPIPRTRYEKPSFKKTRGNPRDGQRGRIEHKQKPASDKKEDKEAGSVQSAPKEKSKEG